MLDSRATGEAVRQRISRKRNLVLKEKKEKRIRKKETRMSRPSRPVTQLDIQNERKVKSPKAKCR